MSTKHVRTAADLVRFGCGLKVECRSCGHVLTLEGHEVAREAGMLPLRELERRLKCSRCSSKSARMAVLGPPPPRN